ncbi:hypothetical protein PVAG01_08829 [Phlyctema vagabunda]|uniref:Uncharacterized protein n=1 Tax=Phlyctema vagabunda TaxID=108571 RepID=A0ABR4PAL2_9HELO
MVSRYATLERLGGHTVRLLADVDRAVQGTSPTAYSQDGLNLTTVRANVRIMRLQFIVWHRGQAEMERTMRTLLTHGDGQWARDRAVVLLTHLNSVLLNVKSSVAGYISHKPNRRGSAVDSGGRSQQNQGFGRLLGEIEGDITALTRLRERILKNEDIRAS